jgi:V8-like Glu-specific endopeptidase
MQNHSKNNPLELQGNFSVGSFHVSVVGGLGSDELPQLEAFDKVLKIVRERSHTENIPLVSVAINPEGFLPTSFLETGIKYSQAVCRIARYFSLSDFKAFITQIQQAIATHTNVSSSFDTLAKVIEVFSIPRQVANDIFNIGSYKEIPNLENPLEVLKNNITENSLAKINPIPIGTGFLVGGSHLLTNHHVIESKEIAAQCVAQFNYVENAQGYIQKSIDYEFDPILFVTEPDLDYTLVQLKSGMFTRQAGYEFGWAQLIEDDECVKPGLDWVEFQGTVREKVVSAWAASQEAVEQLTKKGYIVVKEAGAIVIWHLEGKYDQDEIKTIGVQMGYEQFADALKRVSNSNQIQRTMGDSVIIVQHPKGKQKQIVLSNNEIIKNGLFQGVLRYRAESDYGSSGSPVFNTRWKLVALHHAAVPGSPEISSTQNQQTANGAVKPVAQQGIRICRIIEDLRRKSNTNSKLRSFIQDFVITAEQLNYPPLPAVARLNGGVSGLKNGYYDCGNDVSLDISEAITCEAWVAKHNDENGVLFHRSEILQGERTGYWIWWIQGKLRLEILNQEHSHILCDTKKPAPQDGLWHHIAFTWSTSQEPKIYIDGEQQETHKIEWRPVQTLSSINAPVLIGAGEIGVGVGNPHLGAAIAEVRLWKTARTQTQIKQTMYRRLTGDHHEEGLIGHWQFEEGRVSNIVYNIASLEGGSNVPSIDLFTPSPKIQPQFGLELNGTNDSIDCGNFVIDKAITFEAWIKSSGRNEYSFIAGQGLELKMEIKLG